MLSHQQISSTFDMFQMYTSLGWTRWKDSNILACLKYIHFWDEQKWHIWICIKYEDFIIPEYWAKIEMIWSMEIERSWLVEHFDCNLLIVRFIEYNRKYRI